MYKNTATLLKSPLFRGIDSGNIGDLLNCLQPLVQNFEKDQYIARAGEHFRGIGIIVTGSAAISRESAAGNRVFLDMLQPGEMFGEMAAYSGQKQWPATVQAQQPTDVYFISPQRINGQCGRACPWHRMLIENMLEVLSRKGRMLVNRVDYLMIKGMRAKLSSYLLEQIKNSGRHSFMLPLNRNQLAEYLNVSRPSMCRELGRMRDEGVLEFHRSAFRVLDLERLQSMAE